MDTFCEGKIYPKQVRYIGFKISADLISPSTRVRVMEIVGGTDGCGRYCGTIVKYDSRAISSCLEQSYRTKQFRVRLTAAIKSSLLLWVEFRRVMKVESEKYRLYVSRFEKRGNFAQNAKFWHFSNYHYFKVVRASDLV